MMEAGAGEGETDLAGPALIIIWFFYKRWQKFHSPSLSYKSNSQFEVTVIIC